MIKTKKIYLIICCLFLAAVLVLVFADKFSSNVTSKEEIRIGYFHGGRVFVPYRAYVFKEFDKAGLNVVFYTAKESNELFPVPKSALEMKKIREKIPNFGRLTGRTIIDYITKDELDGGAVGESSFIEAAEMGLPIVAVAKLGHDTKGKAIIVRKGSGIKEPKDFIGKTMISREAGPGDSTFLREFFESIGINPSEVNIIDYASPSYVTEALKDDEVDGGFYHHLKVVKLVSEGSAEIYQPFDWVNPELSQALLIFRKDYYDSHQKEIKKFLEVYLDRIKYERDHPVEDYYGQGEVEEKGLRVHLRFAGMDLSRFDYPPLLNEDLLNQMQDLLQKHKTVEYPPVDLSPYINQTLLQELMNERF